MGTFDKFTIALLSFNAGLLVSSLINHTNSWLVYLISISIILIANIVIDFINNRKK